MCGEMCFNENWSHAHKVKEEDLQFLQERHCTPALQISLKCSTPICCHHYLQHNHKNHRAGFELSEAPGELPTEEAPRKMAKIHSSKHF